MLDIHAMSSTIIALILAVSICPTTRAEVRATNPRNPITEAAFIEGFATEQLVAALGHVRPSQGVRICIEISRRFQNSALSEREAIMSQLTEVLESAPNPGSRSSAIACLAGIASAPMDRDTKIMILEIMRGVVATETEATVLAAAVRLVPNIDQSQSSLSLLSDLLDHSRVVQVNPALRKEILLSIGRFGPQAITILKRYLPIYPEASIIALSTISSEEAISLLVLEAGGRHRDQRYYAIDALGMCAASQELSDNTRALLIRALERAAKADSDQFIRQKATEWLKESDQPQPADEPSSLVLGAGHSRPQ